MTDAPVSLAEVRATKAADARLWSPLDCLRAVIRDIESGEIAPEQISVQFMERKKDGEGRWYSGYCAGVTFPEHIVLLEMAKDRVKQLWRNGD